MDSGTWDEFVRRGKGIVNSGKLKDELYKFEIGAKMAVARAAVLNDADNWQDLLSNALEPQHPIPWRHLSDFRNWYTENPDVALSALRGIWTREQWSIDDRIRAFTTKFPRTATRGAMGSRTTIISALLMGLDVVRYPPYRTDSFTKAYERTGYDKPKQNAEEAALYEHALGFLDRLIDEGSKRELTLNHRLDAQSVVWLQGWWDSQHSPEATVPQIQIPAPDLPTLATKLHLTPEFLREIETLLYDKKQVIFQGPPGTGKTYVAQALAEHLAGGSKNRVTLVQLHPSYAYEDFVQGFRPALIDRQASFQLKDGPLLRAAENARTEPNAKHFLVIDEINRGNPAKVFGELYFLLEYRDKAIDLQYRGEDGPPFSLPDNLYIIGTMNTADRSIALVDLALRRRFYFVEFHPDDEPVKDVLSLWLEANDLDMEWLADVVKLANEKMKNDRHAAIGPSYFMKDGLDEKAVRRIWKHSVRPYIEERRFGEGDLGQFDLDTLREEVRRNRDGEDGEPQADADSGVETVDGSAQ